MSSDGARPRTGNTGGVGFGAETYGESFADVYDEWYRNVTDAGATARFVVARCGGQPVLELGVGTGRLARPLTDLGTTVVGIDVSAAMLARCGTGAPTGGGPGRLDLIRADMAALPVRAGFGAVLIGFNTLFNMIDAAGQQRVIVEAARVLAPGGVVIVEASNLALAGASGSSIAPGRPLFGGVAVVATVVDAEAQTIAGQHVEITDRGVRHRPWALRWAEPAEIDRYAARAGLDLAERYRSWGGERFDESSDSHVSVYRPSVSPPSR